MKKSCRCPIVKESNSFINPFDLTIDVTEVEMTDDDVEDDDYEPSFNITLREGLDTTAATDDDEDDECISCGLGVEIKKEVVASALYLKWICPDVLEEFRGVDLVVLGDGRMDKKGMKIIEVVTDAHVQISSLMKKNYPDIKHSFDVWHGTKNLGKKIIKAGQEKKNKGLLDWTKDVVNHYCYDKQRWIYQVPESFSEEK
uniref:Uncharacterized protein n=1 Tax=Magallana gigas TaxID=29159 RepID=A0A8W8MJ25_MAGGI